MDDVALPGHQGAPILRSRGVKNSSVHGGARPRGGAFGENFSYGPHDIRRPASTSMAFPLGQRFTLMIRPTTTPWVNGPTQRRNHARSPTRQGWNSMARSGHLPRRAAGWPAPGSEDTELGVLMELEVGHGETGVYPRVRV